MSILDILMGREKERFKEEAQAKGKRLEELKKEKEDKDREIESLRNKVKRLKERISVQNESINILKRNQFDIPFPVFKDDFWRKRIEAFGYELWRKEKEIMEKDISDKEIIILADTDLDGIAPASALVRSYKEEDPEVSIEIAPVMEGTLYNRLNYINSKLRSNPSHKNEVVYILDTVIPGEAEAEELEKLSEITEINYIDHHPETKNYDLDSDILMWGNGSTSRIVKNSLQKFSSDPFLSTICELGEIYDGKKDEHGSFTTVRFYSAISGVYGGPMLEKLVYNIANGMKTEELKEEHRDAKRLLAFTKEIIKENKIHEDEIMNIYFVEKEKPYLRGEGLAFAQVSEEDNTDLDFYFKTLKNKPNVKYKTIKNSRTEENMRELGKYLKEVFGGESWGFSDRCWGVFSKNNWDKDKFVKEVGEYFVN